MKKKYIVGAIALVVLIAVSLVLGNSKEANEVQLDTAVLQGEFEVLVATTGELQSSNSLKITGPSELRNRSLGIREVKIQDLVPEGTLVDSGDYVAMLDKSDVSLKLKDLEDELEKIESQFLKTKLDTTIKLRDLRDDLVNLKFAMEEAQIKLEQSRYEPPATIRQAEINVDKAKRSYNQSCKNYGLKVQQAEADMKEADINLQKQKRQKQNMVNVLGKFVVKAPASGMVIYTKEWSGQKRKVGSTINPWDLRVATLPDLTSMRSKTYVNEIDISKLKVGQQVRLGVDAFPDKQYTGKVLEVANIGEQLPNTDAKVFEVMIEVFESDPILRPSMTTSNSILISQFEDVLYLPLEAVHTNDSLSYVYTKSGDRQVVVIDEQNDNYVIIEKGLEANQKVLLTEPEKVEKYRWKDLEFVDLIRTKERRKQEVADSILAAEEAQKQKMKQMGQMKMQFSFK